MKYLITGGAGFIGTALVKRLATGGHHITVLDDFSRGRPARLAGLPDTVHTIQGDIRDPDTVTKATTGADSVIHLAYLQGTQTFYAEPRHVLDVALRGILNVLEACESTGARDLMLVSSSEAYQVATQVPTPETVPLTVPDVLNPRYSYGGGKIASELAALAWQRTGALRRLIIARPHNITGPDMGREHVLPEFCLRMNELVREHPHGVIPFPIQGSGQETRSFCHIDDAVTQLCLLLERAPDGAHVYHVGVEDERTIAQVAHQVAACYGREIEIRPGRLPEGSPPRRLPDTRKVRALTDPPLPATGTVTFADTIADTAAWYQAHG